MFRKTKNKIVASMVSVLFSLLLITMLTAFVISKFYIRAQDKEMLQRYIDLFSLEDPPGMVPPWAEMGEKPAGTADERQDAVPLGEASLVPDAKEAHDSAGATDVDLYSVSSFYSVSIAHDGTILYVDTGRLGGYRAEELVEMAKALPRNAGKLGTMGDLLYQVESREAYTLIAFMDLTSANRSLKIQFYVLVLVSLSYLILFYLIGQPLVKHILHPLEENDRRQKQFISDAEHELKTPISVIGTNAEILSRELGENQWLSAIRFENEHMANLVGELLDLSRAEQSREQWERIDLAKLVEEHVLPFESVAFEHGRTLRTDLGETELWMQGSRRQLGQLVSILTDNAITYAYGQGDIEILLRRDHKYGILKVSNPGREISEEEKERIFDRFYRVDKAREEGESHFGLGLSIARAITDHHGGEIRVEGKDGIVSFIVSLPLNF